MRRRRRLRLGDCARAGSLLGLGRLGLRGCKLAPRGVILATQCVALFVALAQLHCSLLELARLGLELRLELSVGLECRRRLSLALLECLLARLQLLALLEQNFVLLVVQPVHVNWLTRCKRREAYSTRTLQYRRTRRPLTTVRKRTRFAPSRIATLIEAHTLRDTQSATLPDLYYAVEIVVTLNG